MSYNELTIFPHALDQFTQLETLNLSNNHIGSVSRTIEFPVSLRHLVLSYNNITNWLHINPNVILQTATNLHTLNLAGNALRSFSANDERLLLISSSLQTLDLSECQIPKIMGALVLSGMTNLEHLILNGNPLITLPDLKADKLLSLDVSNCNLQTLRPFIFSHMPMLTYVNLSENHRLSLYGIRDDTYVESKSLRRIDLSHCNMDRAELRGFPNITTVLLKGNLITQLTEETFRNNQLIENLDISYNNINHISEMAFRTMKRLRNLDLTVNGIRRLETDTFKYNQQLSSVNLSRNYIDKFRSIASKSLTYLNVSSCEIFKIESDALNAMPELSVVDLSNNPFDELPPHLNARLLHTLDLSRCR